MKPLKYTTVYHMIFSSFTIRHDPSRTLQLTLSRCIGKKRGISDSSKRSNLKITRDKSEIGREAISHRFPRSRESQGMEDPFLCMKIGPQCPRREARCRMILLSGRFQREGHGRMIYMVFLCTPVSSYQRRLIYS